ncbi:hypothetical protein O0L34_g17800 [Tuta absoluta]|nr:hypothetical protein O0L34_g17800 [Tuta absoluta]
MEERSPFSTTKKKRAQWTSQQMENAVKMVERGILSTYTAAARYNIPRKTLRNHLQSGSTERKLGRSAILSSEQEAGLVRRIVRLADVGVPLTPKMLRIQAYSFSKIMNIPNSFNDVNNTAGKKWLRLFLKRHPELARRKAQMIYEVFEAAGQYMSEVPSQFHSFGQLEDNSAEV